MDSASIIDQMIHQKDHHIEFMIAPPESNFIIGSQSINISQPKTNHTVKDKYQIEAYHLAKRIFDIISSISLLIISPILIWKIKDKYAFYLNILQVCTGHLTWVGLAHTDIIPNELTAYMNKSSVIHLTSPFKHQNKSVDYIEISHANYVNKYAFEIDLFLIWKERHNLDNRTNITHQ